MGGFLLAKREPNVDIEETEKQLQGSLDVFKKKNLSLNERLVTPDYVVYMFNMFRSNRENTLSLDKDNFICATGSMFYKGKMGEDSLWELHNDFSTDNQGFLQHLLGTYGLIIYKNSRLYLLNCESGIYHVHCDSEKKVFSSSFLAVYKSLDQRTVNKNELFEYLIDGTFYGDKTPIKELELIDSTSIYQLSPVPDTIPKILSYKTIDPGLSFDEMVAEVSYGLVDYFNMVKANFGDSICAGLTAGSDTRLMLALLRKVGVNPYLYVYDDMDSTNVKIASTVANGEGLDLHIDTRENYPKIDRDKFPEYLEKQLYLYDGLGNSGLFENDTDMKTRYERVKISQLQLNGAGDLAMLYYSLPNKSYPLKSFLKSKHDVGYYEMCRGFNYGEYFANLEQKVKRLLQTSQDRMDIKQSQIVLLLFRARYWTGINHMINLQLADALMPFLEPVFIHLLLNVPYEFKYLGRFKAALINHIDPSLAKYPSQYGFAFTDYDNIPLKVKANTFLKYHMPIAFRPFIRAHLWKQQKKGIFPYYLSHEYLDMVFPPGESRISEYVNLDKITNSKMLSRAYSVDLLLSNKY